MQSKSLVFMTSLTNHLPSKDLLGPSLSLLRSRNCHTEHQIRHAELCPYIKVQYLEADNCV